MNERFTIPPPRPTTQAADGLPRWRWTVTEVERLVAAGFSPNMTNSNCSAGRLYR